MTEPLAPSSDLGTTAAVTSPPASDAAYSLSGSYSTVQVLSPTLINDVEYCTIQTSPSGVVASLTVQRRVFDQGGAGVQLTNFASAIEAVMSNPHVIAGVGSQSIDESGLLADTVLFTVQYIDPVRAPNGATAQATVDVGQLDFSGWASDFTVPESINAIIADVYANLKAAAGG